MPLSVEEYLASEPRLLAARAEPNLDKRAVADAEAECRRLWDQGSVGWLTIAEGRHVAELLTEYAKQHGRDAKAEVETNLEGTAGVLVFRGAGRQSLDLACTSPVRAFGHFKHYIEDATELPTSKASKGKC